MSKLKTLVIGLSTAFLLTSYSYANSTNDIVSMAEDIDPVALVQLGNLYRDGNGVTKSYAKAVWYYTVAVNRLNAKGQYELGNMYCKGLGVKRSYEKAFDLYTKSAAQGYLPALSSLGHMYLHG